MSIKLVILKTGENIIADAKEAVKDDKPELYVLNEPFLISIAEPYLMDEDAKVEVSSVKIQMTPWNIFSADKSVVIFPDSVLTIVNPISSIKQMYEERMNGQSS
jgi:hypothetical protein